MPFREDVISGDRFSCLVSITETFTLRCDLPDGTVLRSDEAKSLRIYYDPRDEGGSTSYRKPADWDDSRVSPEVIKRQFEREINCD